MEDETPSTKHLRLKPKEVQLTDPPARPGDGNAMSVELIHHQNRVAEEKAALRRKTGAPFFEPKPEEAPLHPAFKPKEIEKVNTVAHPEDEEAIHVGEILLENRIAEEQSGWARLKVWKRRKSKRTRDFIVVVGSIDLVVAFVMYLTRDVITLVYGISAITLVTSFIGWMMFFVMDDY